MEKTIAAPININSKAFDALVEEICKRNSSPQDHYEVAAIIESIGWNDTMISQTFGCEDVFDLAYEVYMSITGNTIYTSAAPKQKTSFIMLIFMFIKNFLRGAIFALPMAVSVFSMLTLKFSLWSYLYLSTELATSIAIGTILSFMTVGGFTQAIARKGFAYVKQGYYHLAKRIVIKFVKFGYFTCFIISCLMLFTNLFIEAFPYRMTIVIVLFYFFLSSIWLSTTVMYILEKELAFTGLTILGIFMVYILFRVKNLDIIFSQIISLIVVSILAFLYILYVFKKAGKKQEEGKKASLPRMSITLYSILPYFTYGFLYFTLLFSDRLTAWSTNNTYMPYIIWFRGEYELGLDFALLLLIVPMGIIEVVVNKFMVDIEKGMKNFMGYESQRMNNHFLRQYYRIIPVIFLFSAVSAVIVYFVVMNITHIPVFNIPVDLIPSQVTHFVFIVALISYAVIAIALMNAVILFSLSQPDFAGRSTLIALISNLVVGFLLSRWIEYHYAAFGLMAGAIVFLIMTTIMVIRVLKDLDYYLYAGA